MRFFYVLSALCLCLPPVLSQDSCIDTLRELGMERFADAMEAESPDLVDFISKRNDVTLWAPSNDALARNAQVSRLSRRSNNDNAKQINIDPIPPRNGGKLGTPKKNGKKKRQAEQGPRNYPDTNFQKIYTLLDSPEYVNLGPGDQVARFVRNYAAPLDGAVGSLAGLEIVSGLGDTQNTLRGPFKCRNGIIYEVNDPFTFPYPFKHTVDHVNKSQIFLDYIVTTDKLDTFENTPAITIFVPIDEYMTSTCDLDPESYILWAGDEYAAYYSPDLLPGESYTSRSGAIITVSSADNGERLVNGRRLVKPNVPIKNGVIHFIDGPLYDEKPCNSTPTYTTPPVQLPTKDVDSGSAATVGGISTAIIAACGAAFVIFF